MSTNITTREVTNTSSEELDALTRRWVRLLRIGALALVAGMAGLQLVVGAFIPPVMMAAIPPAAAFVASLRWPRGGAIGIGILSLVMLVFFIPDIRSDMANPESATTFVLTGTLTVIAIAAVAAGLLLLTRRDWASAPRAMQSVAAVAIVAMLMIGIGVRLTLDRTRPSRGISG